MDKISIGGHWKISLFLILIGMTTILPRVLGFSDAARMATIQSIVEHQTLAIDQSVFSDGHDKVFIGGKYYAHQPVLTALMGAAVYFPLYHLGIRLSYGWNLAYYLITLFTVRLFWYLGMKAFYSFMKKSGTKDAIALQLTVGLGLGSLYFTWSATYTNHVMAAAALMIGLLYLVRVQDRPAKFWRLFWAGFFISLAGALDHAVLVFYAGFAVYLLFETYSLKDKIGFFLPLLLTIGPTFWTYYAISGSLLPFSVVKSYFIYPGSPWVEGDLLTGIHPKSGWYLVRYSFRSLIGDKGFLLHNPLLLLALPLLVEEIRKQGRWKKEALVIGGASAAMVAYYLLFSQDFSGFAYSIRWFVPLLPVWYIFLYRGFLQDRPRFNRWFPRLYIASVVIASVGLIDPWTSIITGVPFVDNLITLMLGV